MSILNDIETLLEAASVATHIGYAPSGAVVPYAVIRPLIIDGEVIALTGEVIDWDDQTSVYCCGASVEASYNLALLVMRTLQAARAGGTALNTSMGYNGALVEGHYESQVTVQLNLGSI